MKNPHASWIAIAALLAGAIPAAAQDSAPDPIWTCADQPRLEAERKRLSGEITAIAMGGSDRRQKRRGAATGKMAAQAVVGLFIPFGIGLAVGGGVALAEAAGKSARAKRPQPPPAPEPDVAQMIDHQQQIEVQIAALARTCPAAAHSE